jgi:V8-like Glu-specific endopeptidase
MKLLLLLGMINVVFAGGTAVYEKDDRLEAVNFHDDDLIELAHSTAALISKDSFKPISGLAEYLQVFSSTQREEYETCQGTRFNRQVAASFCTGFLIAPDVLATAGHCISEVSECENFYWTFGYKYRKATDAKVVVKKKDIFKCTKILKRKYDPVNGIDFAIVKLHKKAVGKRIFKLRRSGRVATKTQVITMGYPSGTPLKITANAMVLGNRNSKYFVTNLDTFEGNSGSPVIDAQTGLVEGILYEGKEDFNYSDKYKCSKTAVFSSRQADERVMRITEIFK